MTAVRKFQFILILFIFVSQWLAAQELSSSELSNSVDEILTEIYDLVSFEAGETPDWGRVRSLFIDEAIVVLRSSRSSHNILSVDGFIEDFKNFIVNSGTNNSGFLESIINRKIVTVGNISSCFVLYEASVPNSKLPPQKGLDIFQLINKDEKWRIVSIINEIPSSEKQIPDYMFY